MKKKRIFEYYYFVVVLQCVYDINIFTFRIIKQHYSFFVVVVVVDNIL